MAPLTRQERESILNHLLDTILGIPDDEDYPLRISLKENHVTCIDDLDNLGPDEINNLTYTYTDEADPTNTVVKPLPLGNKGNMKYLIKYVKLIVAQYSSDHQGAYPRLDHWQTITWDHFQLYKANPIPPPSMSTKTTTTSSAITSSDFKKSIKRDTSIYPELKDILHFNTWKIQFEAFIVKDQLSHVIDHTYKPPAGTDEEVTFKLSQDFVFSIFASKLKAAEAKQIVMQHLNDNNAQEIYRKLKVEATKSARAQIE